MRRGDHKNYLLMGGLKLLECSKLGDGLFETQERKRFSLALLLGFAYIHVVGFRYYFAVN
jgi:hypothetical protein